MRPYRMIHLAICIILGIALMTGSVFAADQPEGPVIEPKVRQVLAVAGDYLKSADRFTVTMETTMDIVLEDGQKIQYSGLHDIAVRRPDMVKIRSRADLGGFQLWCSDKNFTVLNIEDMTYSSAEVPSGIDKAFDYMAEEYGVAPPMVTLLYSDPIGLIVQRMQTGFYVGLNQVKGVDSHHLAFTSKKVDAQIWVEAGFAPVIRKIVLTYKNEPGSPQATAILSDWNFSPLLPDSMFIFVKPKNAIFMPFDELRPDELKDKQ